MHSSTRQIIIDKSLGFSRELREGEIHINLMLIQHPAYGLISQSIRVLVFHQEGGIDMDLKYKYLDPVSHPKSNPVNNRLWNDFKKANELKYLNGVISIMID